MYNNYIGDTLKLDIGERWNLKGFDAVIGNPPYQVKVGDRKTEPIWHKFIDYGLNNLRDDRFLCLIHPAGWRDIDGKFKKTQRQILSNNLIYLEIHNLKDGLKILGSQIRYDWYILQKNQIYNTTTTIKFEDKVLYDVNVKILEFIPNSHFEKVYSLIAKDGEERVKVIHDYSTYETRKNWMSKTQSEKYRYPCVYTVNSKDKPTFYYSSVQNGHFGVPKLIWGQGVLTSVGNFIDDKGEYGLTQFAYAFVEQPHILKYIKNVFDTSTFDEIMMACAIKQSSYNHKVIGLFKKDFWKLFI